MFLCVSYIRSSSNGVTFRYYIYAYRMTENGSAAIQTKTTVLIVNYQTQIYNRELWYYTKNTLVPESVVISCYQFNCFREHMHAIRTILPICADFE